MTYEPPDEHIKYDHSPWGTRSETVFLSKLGKWHGRTGMSRLGLLRGYITGVQHRRVWGGIDTNEIIRLAAGYIEMEERYGDR